MIVEELEVKLDQAFGMITDTLENHNGSLLDLNKLIGIQREMLERHIERIETLEDEAAKTKEELGGQLKMIGILVSQNESLKEAIRSNADAIDGLLQDHKQYGEHMNQAQ